jgi:hypothetical protein
MMCGGFHSFVSEFLRYEPGGAVVYKILGTGSSSFLQPCAFELPGSILTGGTVAGSGVRGGIRRETAERVGIRRSPNRCRSRGNLTPKLAAVPAIPEGTANFVVNHRMSKSQQMGWRSNGAILLLQVRCAVYNGTFGSGFKGG